MTRANYIGRFAPSPSGDLHFGSLIAALGSFLQARSQHGLWLLRIEDIDPPREALGAAQRILNTLEIYGLYWDGPVLYQSQRHQAYHDALDWLFQHHLAYYCDCKRHRIQQIGGYYDGFCRTRELAAANSAIRLKQNRPVYSFNDKLLGQQQVLSRSAQEDYIIHRRDGLFAYNLAVVVDDHHQGITQVVRGADLIDTTVKQISLFQHFGWRAPEYMHLPLAMNHQGDKLSKQNHAPALSSTEIVATLVKALIFLGQSIPEDWQYANKDEIVGYAVAHWQSEKIPRKQQAMMP